MIKVYIGKGVVEIKGHSGYAEMGKDIVCAGVSALFYAFSGYLEQKGWLMEAEIASGDSYIIFKEGGEAVGMLKEGIKQIAEAYPKYVKLYPEYVKLKNKEA